MLSKFIDTGKSDFNTFYINYNDIFIAKYTDILTGSSVEAANIANNHRTSG